jgi:hypothetical protein
VVKNIGDVAVYSSLEKFHPILHKNGGLEDKKRKAKTK